MNSLSDAVLTGAGEEEIERSPLPQMYLAALLRAEDVAMFQGVTGKDVRKSLHMGLVPMPDLAPDEVVVAVMASSVSYNTVWSAMFEPISTFRFLRQFAAQGGWARRHDRPRNVVGSDAAGVVVRVGSGMRRWRAGDHVVVNPAYVDEQEAGSHDDGMLGAGMRAWGFETNFGGLAEYALVRASRLVPKPAHLTWEEAACNQLCAGTACRMLVGDHGARMKQGDAVLIWSAAGGLGAYAAHRPGRHHGRRSGQGARGRQAARHRDPPPDRPGPDIVFEHVGRATFGVSVFVARRGGTVVTCGSSTGYQHTLDNRYLWMKLKKVIGSHAMDLQEQVETNRLIASGAVVPTMSAVSPLAEVAEAARLVQTNCHLGKIAVLCLASERGLGVTDPALRARIGEERINPLLCLATAGGGTA
ncbi:alcohol dehydrogenase catalytic domain-containing protein [Lentzea sp. NPDC060358]|uniref:alcohol dehydrogenase catalytic domain-containing protein n=1 Tax=Lentzea sp. NPDC060358 TaxID=3347103 RepID=UPI00364CCD76